MADPLYARIFTFVWALFENWWLLVTGIVLMVEPMMESWLHPKRLKWLNKRWPKAGRYKQIRFAALAALLVAAYLAFDAVNVRLTNATTELSATREQRDEARRQLQGLPARGWSIKPEQIRILREAVAKKPLGFPLLLATTPAAPTDSLALAYDLMNAVGDAIVVIGGDPEYSPNQSGIILGYAAGTDPEKNEKVQAVKALLEKAGFVPRYKGHHNFPANETIVVIGKFPSL